MIVTCNQTHFTHSLRHSGPINIIYNPCYLHDYACKYTYNYVLLDEIYLITFEMNSQITMSRFYKYICILNLLAFY